jgi:hypothetical protein
LCIFNAKEVFYKRAVARMTLPKSAKSAGSLVATSSSNHDLGRARRKTPQTVRHHWLPRQYAESPRAARAFVLALVSSAAPRAITIFIALARGGKTLSQAYNEVRALILLLPSPVRQPRQCLCFAAR